MDYPKLAELLYPNITKTIEELEKEYPRRELPDKAEVLRFAPSPTGRIHLGNLYAAFFPQTFARQSNGIFILRIEDTDEKRAVENGTQLIIEDLEDYGYQIDESPIVGGNYDPYVQTQREEIYQICAKHLINIGRAYPCFCSEEQLNEMRENQEKRKKRVGYYGNYAKCRNLTLKEVEEKINNNEKYVIRLKSIGDFNKKVIFKDLIKGKMELPENDVDYVLIKSDGIPPYAFAHVVDDHYMRVTTVTRDDSYVSTLTYHLEIWAAFGWEPTKYAHLSPLNVKEGDTVRKLSKRKDPEAAISYHHEKGVPKEAVKLYFATLLNSNFEGWYLQNQDKPYTDFSFTYDKMAKSGSLFDMEKLINLSKNYLSKLIAREVYNRLLIWAEEFDQDFAKLITKYRDYTINVLNIEREQLKPRKDFAFYSEIKDNIYYMYDELYSNEVNLSTVNDLEEFKTIVNQYIDEYYDINDDKETWFRKMKELAGAHDYATDMKDYKLNPENYKGNIADISNMIRMAVTSETKTPDLHQILKLLGPDRIKERISKIL